MQWLFKIVTPIAAGWSLGFLSSQSSAEGQDIVAQTPSSPCAQLPVTSATSELIARSHYIVVATPKVPVQELKRRARQVYPDYLEVSLTQVRTLKGQPPGELTLKVYPRDDRHSTSNAALIAAANVPSLFFLVQVDDPNAAGIYFAGRSPSALQPANPKRVEAIRAEIDRQRQVLASWRPDPTVPHYQEVAELVDGLARGGTTLTGKVKAKLGGQEASSLAWKSLGRTLFLPSLLKWTAGSRWLIQELR